MNRGRPSRGEKSIKYSSTLGLSRGGVTIKSRREQEHMREAGKVVALTKARLLEARESRSRPDRGIVYLESRAFNQREEQVLTLRRRFLVPKQTA